jgi:hypothetical protein
MCPPFFFILQAIFHLIFLGPSIDLFRKAIDYYILLIGLVFIAYGTYNVIIGHLNNSYYVVMTWTSLMVYILTSNLLCWSNLC